MLPIPVANDLAENIRRFLAGSFAVSTPGFRREGDASFVDEFLANSGNIFKGPYLSISLPFRRADANTPLPFQQFQSPFTPYLHQAKAFARLCRGNPLPTLVATGTGSGKTECFMYPLLDACSLDNKPGIKAIIVYPMNALATDQAARFAKTIHEHDELRGRVTVGLFTGDSDHSPQTQMSASHVITCKTTMRKVPPDILLTNYKMLDYLLLRPKDQQLWQHNTQGVLRYLVVDELHTFDGAQGTDLACLIRRLRDRLATDRLACVGTSATVGDDADALLEYASSVFGSRFESDAVIREDRLSVDEFLSRSRIKYSVWPDNRNELLALMDTSATDRRGYLRRAAQLWLPQGQWNTIFAELDWHVALARLGEQLLEHEAFHELMRALAAQPVLDVEALEGEWLRRLNLSLPPGRSGLLDSLVALIAAARCWLDSDAAEEALNDRASLRRQGVGNPALAQKPFLNVRAQLWLRELRRMVASVSRQPVLTHADDLPSLQEPMHLPVVGCRECQMTAWVTVLDPQDGRVSTDLRTIYDRYFSQHADVRLLIPDARIDARERAFVCAQCQTVQLNDKAGACVGCGADEVLPVRMPDLTAQVTRGGVRMQKRKESCPNCLAPNSLYIMGFRAVSLASSLVGRLMHTPLNDDRKLIAFSDSVQDAAHRAGFLTARTYGRVVRTAVRQCLDAMDGSVSLANLVLAIAPYWLDQLKQDEAAFAGTFMPANLMWWEDYRHLVRHGRLPPGSRLVDDLGKRLGWEAQTEMTSGARRGTSLERFGLASAAVPVAQLKSALALVRERLREELPSLDLPSDERLLHWLLGLTHRMRLRGSVSHESTAAYVGFGGKPYALRFSHAWMPFFPAKGGPVLLTVDRKINGFDCAGDSNSWYSRWFDLCFGAEVALASPYSAQALHLALLVLRQQGVVDEYQCAGTSVWALNPAAVLCERQLTVMQCDRCLTSTLVPQRANQTWSGAPCLQLSCEGVLKPEGAPPDTGENYQGHPFRVRAAEHTAMIGREARDQVEKSFKHGQAPWDVSVLSASPTLEMGVDIGDLSSVLLCSTPPAQANYLQRIGRAGRRDGNALAVTIAAGRPHDLYFYADPLRMMDGHVEAPGVFLKAMAVLERQLLAYAMDAWVQAVKAEAEVPATMKAVLDAVESDEEGIVVFPFNWFAWLRAQGDNVLKRFFALFPELDQTMQDYLVAFLKGDDSSGVEWSQDKVFKRLYALASQRKNARSQMDKLKRELDRLEKGPIDEVVEENIAQICAERDALSRLIRNWNRHQTLNFLTDEGLLPNYAFPEEGVTLNSVIVKRSQPAQGEDAQGRHQTETLSYQRAASTALSEFAPENWFYASGRKVRIEQIDLAASPVEHWRFCDRCNYAEPVDLKDQYSSCPRCHSPLWKDANQRRSVVQLRQVMASSRDDESLIGDDSEQREPIFYARQTLIDVPPNSAQYAWRIADECLPFAFEYLPRVKLRDVNFGQFSGQGEVSSVAGQEIHRAGFRICRHCGKLDARWLKFAHAWTCPVKTTGREAKDDDFVHVDLLRELESEAVRILLPVVEMGEIDVARDSLIAAIQLGLRQYFRGQVDHLRVQTYSDKSSGAPRQYLLIHDTVPGGTGYLKELLIRPEVLVGALSRALEVIRNCACVADSQADGCYRCVYAYRNSQNREAISRYRAQEILEQILGAADKLEPIATVADVNVNPLLDSELEQRFVGALKDSKQHLKVQGAIIAQKSAYEILYERDGQSVMWALIPQYKFNDKKGDSHFTVADFLLRPIGHDAQEMAIYLDGFGVHQPQIIGDVQKRLAIRDARQTLVWTLGWKDFPAHGGDPSAGVQHLLRPATSAKAFAAAAPSGASYANCDGWIGGGPFEWLMSYIKNPQATRRRMIEAAASRVRGWLDVALRDPNNAKHQALAYELNENAPSHIAARFQAKDQLAGGLMNCFLGHGSDVEIAVGVGPQHMKGGLQCGLVHVCLDDRSANQSDEFETSWRKFWASVNLFQFIDGCSFATRRGVEQGAFDELGVEAVSSVLDHAWKEVRELCLDWDAVAHLANSGVAEPQVGFELVGDDQAVMAEFELAWPQHRVGVVLADEPAPQISQWLCVSMAEPDWQARVLAVLEKDQE